MSTKLGSLFTQLGRKYSQNASKVLVHKQLSGKRNGISLIGFNRPQQKNALSAELVDSFINVLDQIAYESSARVLIIHSLVPKIFCAGKVKNI